ncbi:MAG TPA: class I SAM-dependent methyltransferase [Candidatus Binatia bacterium]|nr:class I SAM-dependent methyltransferase [Candidatus Binatia bacterium]
MPWDNPDFSRRMLREHLDESHGAASRVRAERQLQIDWFWPKLGLSEGRSLLDVTCGPGLYAVPLARRGLRVVGVDFGPASIAYARDFAVQEGVAGRCTFIEQDVRQADFGQDAFDAALFLYGQAAVFERQEARALLQKIARALRPGGWLCLELLDQEKVDKEDSSWWYADDRGLWGDEPFLSLGQRFWYPDEMLSCERYFTIHLHSGQLDEILLCDQTYSVEETTELLKACGFSAVELFPAWDGLPLYDAEEWNVYVAQK